MNRLSEESCLFTNCLAPIAVYYCIRVLMTPLPVRSLLGGVGAFPGQVSLATFLQITPIGAFFLLVPFMPVLGVPIVVALLVPVVMLVVGLNCHGGYQRGSQ